MSLVQFLRILMARRAIIIAALLAAFVGAMIATQVIAPRYEAKSRVLLDLLKPDPQTGQLLATNMLRNYISTQIELIKDVQTAGTVVDKLGWANDPALTERYAQATNGRGDDVRGWLARQIVDSTDAQLLEQSNILEITYKGTTPESSKQIADLIRDTFIEQNLRDRRANAGRTADWYRDQADKAMRLVTTAETARTKFAKENGIVIDASNTDLESSKLQQLSASSAMPKVASLPAQTSPAKLQLDQIDQQLAQAATTLGPNHPTFQSLQRQRQVIAAEVARSGNTLQMGGGVSVAQINGEYQAQKSRVLAQRDKIDKINQLTRDIDLKRDQYGKAAQQAAEMRVQADVGETDLQPLGNAVVPERPTFPNIPLIIGGSLALGAALGICLALLVELLGRRVRSDEDLGYAAGAPVFAIVGKQRNPDSLVGRVLAFVDRRRGPKRDSLVEATA